MINKIKDWLFSKYGIIWPIRTIWMILILIASLFVLILILFANKNTQPVAQKAGYNPMSLIKK